MQPVYFLPNCSSTTLSPGNDGELDRGILRARGLADVFADVGNIHRDCGVTDVTGLGPGEKSGCILYYQTPKGQVPRWTGYYPANQTWQAVGDGSLLWIGTDNAAPPVAEDFQRKTKHGGYQLTLCDGAEWLVPVIRRPDDSTELPTDMYWDDAGIVQEPIKAAYERYWEDTAEVAGWFFDSGFGNGFSKSRALEMAVQALGLNYRFGRNEQNAFRVIDKNNFISVLAVTVDFARWEEIAKSQKKSG